MDIALSLPLYFSDEGFVFGLWACVFFPHGWLKVLRTVILTVSLTRNLSADGDPTDFASSIRLLMCLELRDVWALLSVYLGRLRCKILGFSFIISLLSWPEV
jgi:hypothetical protein